MMNEYLIEIGKRGEREKEYKKKIKKKGRERCIVCRIGGKGIRSRVYRD